MLDIKSVSQNTKVHFSGKKPLIFRLQWWQVEKCNAFATIVNFAVAI